MNPILAATLRRHWPLVGAAIVFLGFTAVDQIWFRPEARRFQVAVRDAAEVGMAIDPEKSPPILPPRLFALLADNAMPAAEAQEQGNSGALTAQLMGDLTSLMGRHGIEVIVTEPGPVTQQPQSVEVRAHLKLRCRYPDFVAMLDEIARGDHLIAMERFSLAPLGGGMMSAEVWMTRYVLKHVRSHG